MTMQETISQDRAAVEAVRTLPCSICWAGVGGVTGEACGIFPEGDHLAHWAQARRAGLITAEQIGAALDSILVITGGTLVLNRITQ